MCRALAVMSSLFLWSHLAWALPPPKTEAELMKASDLVVDAKCVSIVCIGKPVDDGQKIITSYQSTLWPSKGYKGSLPKSFVIKGQNWKYKGGSVPVGGWHQGPVPKGWAGKLYLKKLPDGSYTKVWWNADQEDKARSKPQPLPLCMGDGGVPDAAVPDTTPPPDGKPTVDNNIGEATAPKPDSALADHSAPGEGIPHRESDSHEDGRASPDGGSSTKDDSGCSCSVQSPAAPALPLLVWGLLGVLWLRRRKAGR